MQFTLLLLFSFFVIGKAVLGPDYDEYHSEEETLTTTVGPYYFMETTTATTQMEDDSDDESSLLMTTTPHRMTDYDTSEEEDVSDVWTSSTTATSRSTMSVSENTTSDSVKQTIAGQGSVTNVSTRYSTKHPLITTAQNWGIWNLTSPTIDHEELIQLRREINRTRWMLKIFIIIVTVFIASMGIVLVAIRCKRNNRRYHSYRKPISPSAPDSQMIFIKGAGV